jgi:hypothetical protein
MLVRASVAASVKLRHFGLTRFLDLGGWNNYMDVAHQAGHTNTHLLEEVYGHPDKLKAPEGPRRLPAQR